VERETRHFLEGRGITQSARSKEQEHDYRYFPEPDLRPIQVQSWVKDIVLPELPDARRERFIAQYGCSLNHARTLTGELRLANFFERVVAPDTGLCSLAATWIADTLIGELNYRDMSIDALDPGSLTSLCQLVKSDTITDKSAIEVLRVMLDERRAAQTCETPEEIVTRLNLKKTSGDASALAAIIREVIAENAKAVEDYRAGKNGAMNFLVGCAMKKTRGRSDPKDLNREIALALKPVDV